MRVRIRSRCCRSRSVWRSTCRLSGRRRSRRRAITSTTSSMWRFRSTSRERPGWLRESLRMLDRADIECVVVDGVGPAASLIVPLREAGVEVEVVTTSRAWSCVRPAARPDRRRTSWRTWVRLSCGTRFGARSSVRLGMRGRGRGKPRASIFRRWWRRRWRLGAAAGVTGGEVVIY